MANPEFVVGDTRKALRVTVLDSSGARVDLSGGTVRLHAKGDNSGDMPTTDAGGNPSVASCTLNGTTTVTTSNNFNLVSVGALVVGAGNINPGTYVAAKPNSTTITLSEVALTTTSTTLQFWNGLLGVFVTNGTDGDVEFQSLGGKLGIGSRTSDSYTYRVKYTDGSAKISWSVPSQSFTATKPPV